MNKVTKASVVVKFESSSRCCSDAGSRNQPGSTALQWGIREIARVMAINGEGDLAASLVAEAIAAVQKDLGLPAEAPTPPAPDADDVGDLLERAARIPREYAQELDSMGWGNRFPDELTAIFNASTNMAQRIRALRNSKEPSNG